MKDKQTKKLKFYSSRNSLQKVFNMSVFRFNAELQTLAKFKGRRPKPRLCEQGQNIAERSISYYQSTFDPKEGPALLKASNNLLDSI